MDILKQTKELCHLYNIKPSKEKGQNFLIDEKVYNDIVETANIEKNDLILEVGPGLGFLTAQLAKRAKKVIAVEIDMSLANILKSGLQTKIGSNVEILNQNILDFKEEYLKDSSYKIVANLPYNITSVFLRKFLEFSNKPKEMVLMLQKEVVDRIVAGPGKMSILAISVQFYADVEKICFVEKNKFFPAPEVDSAVIRIVTKKDKFKVDEKQFFRLVKIGFSAKRKMLKNNLANGYHISDQKVQEILINRGFSPKTRAQELSLPDWIKILPDFM